MGFGRKCGNSRAARADGTHAWVWDRRFEQLARMERDWAAHTTALETADAVKGVHRPKDCATKASKRRGINITAGPCGRPTAESGKRRRGKSYPHIGKVKPEIPKGHSPSGHFDKMHLRHRESRKPGRAHP